MSSPLPPNGEPTDRQKIWCGNYEDGVPARLEQATRTIVDVFDSSVCQWAAKDALEFFGKTTTFAELAEQVDRCAEGLRRMGVTKGDRVALLLPNCPEAVIAFYGILRLGAVVVEHNPLYTEHELAQPFYDHGARVAICWDKIASKIVKLRRTSDLENVVTVDITQSLPKKLQFALRLPFRKTRKLRESMTSPPRHTFPWERLLDHPRIAVEHPRPSIGDPALMLYTSGTTGTPKGAVLTHFNLASELAMSQAWIQKAIPGKETILVTLPPFHAYGILSCTLLGVSIGAKQVLLPSPDINLIMKVFKRETPTFIPAVPPIYQRILRESKKRKISIKGVRLAFSGAMSLPMELVEEWENATGGIITEGYGLTETSPIIAGNPMDPALRKAGSVGVPFPETEIRIVDVADGVTELDFNEPGELVVRGPQVFSGYHNMPDATEKAMHGGWFHTGDVAVMDEHGYITIVDRLKEMIITGGFNVYPSEVEEELAEHPSIAECAVVGVRNRNGGEMVAAAVVLEHGARLNEEALRDHCRNSLTRYKVPKRIVALEEIPKNVMGKVLRKEASKQVQEFIDQHPTPIVPTQESHDRDSK